MDRLELEAKRDALNNDVRQLNQKFYHSQDALDALTSLTQTAAHIESIGASLKIMFTDILALVRSVVHGNI